MNHGADEASNDAMPGDTSRIDPGAVALPVTGLADLTTPIFRGADMSETIAALTARIDRHETDAAALLDLGLIHQLYNLQAEGLDFQRRALEHARHFRVVGQEGTDGGDNDALRVLMLVRPGTFQDNTPAEFLLGVPDIRLELLFLMPDEPLPACVPEHDLLLNGIGYSSASRPLLDRMMSWLEDWPRPVLNRPEHVLNTSREALLERLGDQPGIFVAPIARLSRASVAAIAEGAAMLADHLEGGAFPILIRPLDSHAGNDLDKIEAAEALLAYLDKSAASEFYLTQFVDYRDGSGLFAKSRVVLIEERAFLAHHAMNDHWMIHYLNAGMMEDRTKRDLEAAAMAGFDKGFARRHARAFRAIRERLGLDYLILDCSETPDGRLFLFEADTIMIVHAMDRADLYPYKKPQMDRIFDAFRGYLLDRAALPGETREPD